MKNLSLPLLLFFLLLAIVVQAQIPVSSPSPTSRSTSYACEVIIDIYNGLYDWEAGKPYSGGQLLPSDKKKSLGAVTVVNKNNTDGDFDATGNDKRDLEDNSVSSSTPVGRNEIDLIKIVIRKRDPGVPLSGSGDITLSVPSNVRVWAKPTKEMEVSVSAGIIEIDPAELTPVKEFYMEAVAPSAMVRDMKFEIIYDGKKDYALATAVWVDITRQWFENATTPIPGSASLPNANKEKFVYTINQSWISANGQRYGFGPYYSGQPVYPSPPHPLTALLPGTQDKEIGGRIMFEFKINPPNAEELVEFDCARQKKVRGYRIDDFIETPIAFETINFPFEENKNVEEANDDTNNVTDEDQEPTASFIYSSDRPSSYIIQTDRPEMGFKINKITLIEYARLKVKGLPPFPFNGNVLIGSRCSDKMEWHCFYYLRRSTVERKLLPDNAVASTSEPNPLPVFGGNGYAVINTQSNAPTAAYTLMFATGDDPDDPADDYWILLDSFGGGDFALRNPNGSSWTITYNNITVNIFEGTIEFAEDDTYFFNTFNSTAKTNEILLGKKDVLTPP